MKHTEHECGSNVVLWGQIKSECLSYVEWWNVQVLTGCASLPPSANHSHGTANNRVELCLSLALLKMAQQLSFLDLSVPFCISVYFCSLTSLFLLTTVHALAFVSL